MKGQLMPQQQNKKCKRLAHFFGQLFYSFDLQKKRIVILLVVSNLIRPSLTKKKLIRPCHVYLKVVAIVCLLLII